MASAEAFIRSIEVADRDGVDLDAFPWTLPAVAALADAGLALDPAVEDPETLDAYGGRSLHEQSHGESFLALLLNRFGPIGLYFLDEPEAALSAQNCLTCLRRMSQLVREGSQFVVATHSPILLAFPGASGKVKGSVRSSPFRAPALLMGRKPEI